MLNQRSFTSPDSPRTAYFDIGSGSIIVWVHGVGLNAEVWLPQISLFSNQYRCLAYDTLGHGSSDLPPEDASLQHYLDQLHRFLDALEIEQTILVGHSMGALIATGFAIQHPHRIKGLVGLNPVYKRTATHLQTSTQRAKRLLEDGPHATLEEALHRWFGDRMQEHAEEINKVRHWISQVNPLGYATAYRVFADADSYTTDKMSSLTMPALFSTGDSDLNSTPKMSEMMAEEVSDAQAFIFSGERHMMAYISPQKVNPILEKFFSRVEG